jgi:uncharacterized protein (DUF4415 family)
MKNEKGNDDGLTPKQRASLAAIAAIPDDQIRTDLIPEQLDWSSAKIGLFYRPIKKQITLRIDADLIEWFRQHSTAQAGYQTHINEALRKYVGEQGQG